MSIFSSAWSFVKHLFKDDIEPSLTAFLEQFAGDEGHLILTTALAAAPALATGNFGIVAGQVVATLITQSEAIAAQDATKTLQQVQSALQIAKVAQNIVTPGDHVILASTPAAAPVPISPAATPTPTVAPAA